MRPSPLVFTLALASSLGILTSCSSNEGGSDSGEPVEDGGAPRAEAAAALQPILLPLAEPLTAAELGLVINTDDPQSVAVGTAYIEARKIPSANVVRLALGAPAKDVSAETFQQWKTQVDAALPASVQALALTFTQPSLVEGCQSITAAFTFGYDAKYCVACERGPESPFFQKPTSRPFTDDGIRPSMMLAASSTAEAEKLIARGVAADGTFPPGKAYFVRTTDVPRSGPRYQQFQAVTKTFATSALETEYVDETNGGASDLVDAPDVLFYMTGRERIPGIGTNTYRPGAFADHLTSFAGAFTSTCDPTGQMNVLCWLEAGVTASYGTVVEPCNHPQKFPDARILTETYFRGATVLEAAWASVAWPGQGVFVGEPLARPFGSRLTVHEDVATIDTTELVAKETYVLEGASDASGPWTTVEDGIVVARPTRYTVDVDLGWSFLRFREQ